MVDNIEDKVVALLHVDDERCTLELHVITKAARTVAFLMTSECMSPLVDSYAIFCAKQAMLFRHTVRTYTQPPLDRYRAHQRRCNGMAWPLMPHVHPVCRLTAEKAYMMAVMEFLPDAIKNEDWMLF